MTSSSSSRQVPPVVMVRVLRGDVRDNVIRNRRLLKSTKYSIVEDLTKLNMVVLKRLKKVTWCKKLDIVDHTVIMSKLAKLQLPGNIYNWIGAFLSNRDQICRYRGFVSKSTTCNRGFV